MTNQEEKNRLVQWIRDYLNTAVPDAKYQAIIGLSGGIDSAVVAALCVEAVGQNKVLGVIMPCDSDAQDTKLGCKLAKDLDVDIVGLDLENTFYSLSKEIKHSALNNGRMPRLVMGNLKARLRMASLYTLSGLYGGLVIGTTNKTEQILGFCTKYGDNAVDIEPIQEFLKYEVYELAKMFDTIPEEIITRKPTAGLWEGQTDEDELQVKYSTVDHLLEKYGIDKLISINDNSKDFFTSFSYEESNTLRKIVKLYKANLHKDFHLPHFKRS